ncbi:MAG: hypothetical protein ACTHJ6_01530 [Oryzihumus sp.]|jgi:hypothetical protein
MLEPMPSSPARQPFKSPFNLAREAAVRPVERFEVGERVTHDRHGLGRVTACDGEAAVYVDFGHGVRRVTLPTSKLHRL